MDSELLRTYRKQPSAERFRPLLARHLVFVHAAALRQTATDVDAAAVTRAAFLALARRARIPKRVLLAGWLLRTVRLTARKVRRDALKRHRASPPPTPTIDGVNVWTALAQHLDTALDTLPRKLRDVILVRTLLQHDSPEASAMLRLRERRVEKRLSKGLRKLVRRLRKRWPGLDAETLQSLCREQGLTAVIPNTLEDEILSAIPMRSTRGTEFALMRRTLAALTWAKWKHRFKIGFACLGVLVLLLGTLAGTGYFLWKTGRLFPLIATTMMRFQSLSAPELAQLARPWVPDPSASPGAAAVRTGGNLFQTTRIWPAHLKFSAAQWKELTPRQIPSMPDMMQPGGKMILRNPKARRSGLSGVIGFEFDWAHSDFELGGRPFPDTAARIKGNGTFLGSLHGMKRSFKVDLDKFNKGQEVGGIEVVNFTNLIEDRSYMADALAHEFFRDSGIPAPRTAYAYLSLTVGEEFDHKPLGLYLLVENLDRDFAKNRFGTKAAPIFKPVTYELFQDIGAEWSDYAAIYDLKTKATRAQQRRVIGFSTLLSHADDAEFARRLGEFLDLDEFARFLAGLVLVSSYDGFFTNGQNFYVYLDPRSDKFGFIAWDLDHAWGNFPFVGTPEMRERASIWHPWVGEHRFLERVTKVEAFRKIYRERLEEMLATTFVPGRLNRRIDEIAAAIRPAVAAESDFRLARFEQAVSGAPLPRWDGEPFDPKRTAHQLKRFIANRVKSVRAQLDGKSKGILIDQISMGGN
jgi:DNA-directed RNA polymerase specialized sigma24 family protein